MEWWKKRYPQVPERIWALVRGQGLNWEEVDDGKEYPSFWEWEETEGFLTRQTNMFKIRIHQGALGHQRPKPTTLLTNMEQMKELDGVTASSPGEEIHTDLERKLKQTATWSTWAPGLMAALKVVIPKFLSEQAQQPVLSKLDLAGWKKHLQAQHVPYRRDCKVCLETMGSAEPHRRKKGQESAFVMSVDVCGPFVKGTDLGVSKRRKVKYALIATIPVPQWPTPGETEVLPKDPKEDPEAGSSVELAADFLTKPITVGTTWSRFRVFAGLCDLNEPEDVETLKKIGICREWALKGLTVAVELEKWKPESETQHQIRRLGLVAVGHAICHVVQKWKSHLCCLKRKERPPRENEPGLGKPPTEKGWLRENEPSPNHQMKALRENEPSIETLNPQSSLGHDFGKSSFGDCVEDSTYVSSCGRSVQVDESFVTAAWFNDRCPTGCPQVKALRAEAMASSAAAAAGGAGDGGRDGDDPPRWQKEAMENDYDTGEKKKRRRKKKRKSRREVSPAPTVEYPEEEFPSWPSRTAGEGRHGETGEAEEEVDPERHIPVDDEDVEDFMDYDDDFDDGFDPAPTPKGMPKLPPMPLRERGAIPEDGEGHAEEAGAPAEEAGAPAEEAGAPADDAGAPAGEAGEEAAEPRAATAVKSAPVMKAMPKTPAAVEKAGPKGPPPKATGMVTEAVALVLMANDDYDPDDEVQMMPILPMVDPVVPKGGSQLVTAPDVPSATASSSRGDRPLQDFSSETYTRRGRESGLGRDVETGFFDSQGNRHVVSFINAEGKLEVHEEDGMVTIYVNEMDEEAAKQANDDRRLKGVGKGYPWRVRQTQAVPEPQHPPKARPPAEGDVPMNRRLEVQICPKDLPRAQLSQKEFQKERAPLPKDPGRRLQHLLLKMVQRALQPRDQGSHLRHLLMMRKHGGLGGQTNVKVTALRSALENPKVNLKVKILSLMEKMMSGPRRTSP